MTGYPPPVSKTQFPPVVYKSDSARCVYCSFLKQFVNRPRHLFLFLSAFRAESGPCRDICAAFGTYLPTADLRTALGTEFRSWRNNTTAFGTCHAKWFTAFGTEFAGNNVLAARRTCNQSSGTGIARAV